MDRREWLTTCVVAVGVAGISVALFSPKKACAKGPLEGVRPKVAVASMTYKGCKITVMRDFPPSTSGKAVKLTLECRNNTSRMIDFPATLTWNEVSVPEVMSRVALPTKRLKTLQPQQQQQRTNLAVSPNPGQKLRCITFPNSTASFDIAVPATQATKATNGLRVLGMRQLVIRVGNKTLMSPSISF